MFKTYYIIFVTKHNGDPLGFISLLIKNLPENPGDFIVSN